MTEPQTLEACVSEVIGKVKRLFLDLVDGPEKDAEYQPWATEMTAMMRATTESNYICEDNLVVLMNWRMTVSEHWEKVSDAFRAHEREHYNTLQVKMDSIIDRIQFKILMDKLGELRN
jgi:hypothetical protein